MQEEVTITNSTEVGEIVNNKNGERRKTTVFMFVELIETCIEAKKPIEKVRPEFFNMCSI